MDRERKDEKPKVNPDYSSMYDSSEYLQQFKYFYKNTGSIPNRRLYKSIEVRGLYEFLRKKYSIKQEDIIQSDRFNKSQDKILINECLLKISDDIMVYIANENGNCKQAQIIYGGQTDSRFFDEIEQIVREFRVNDEGQNKINLLCTDKSTGLFLKEFELGNTELDIDLNYNDDFKRIHKIIVEKLQTEKDKGIVLLHGQPGTGKTTYLRHLSSLVKKTLIYIPPDFAHKIADPEFISLMIDYPNSVLIIEDAENVIRDRMSGDNASVANLLNISDGLLSDCLNIQLICTFNTDISKVDTALLRKGRIIAKYEFRELETEKAQLLSDMLGYNQYINKPMTLAEIYNQSELDFMSESKKNVGFELRTAKAS